MFVAATRFRRQPTASASVSVPNVPANRQTPPDRSLSDTLELHRSPPRFQRIIAATGASAFLPFSTFRRRQEAESRLQRRFLVSFGFSTLCLERAKRTGRAVISRRSNTREKFKPGIFPAWKYRGAKLGTSSRDLIGKGVTRLRNPRLTSKLIASRSNSYQLTVSVHGRFNGKTATRPMVSRVPLTGRSLFMHLKRLPRPCFNPFASFPHGQIENSYGKPPFLGAGARERAKPRRRRRPFQTSLNASLRPASMANLA